MSKTLAKPITRKEACELIRSCIGKDMPEGEVFDKIVYAVNNDFQVRDFLMGLPQYYDTQEVINFLGHMSTYSKVEEDIPFIVVTASLAYEVGAMEEFYKHVGYASVHRPDYSLNKVLMQAASLGYPGKMLTKMREELHAKVMELCYKTEADFVIEPIGDNNGEHVPSVPDLQDSSENSGQETSGEAESGSLADTQSQPGVN